MKIEENISLATLTTFKVGGVARYFVSVRNKQEFVDSLKWAKEKNLPVFILGGGSNILVSDDGFRGLVIKNEMTGIDVSEYEAVVSSGENLAKVVQIAAGNSLSGLEWAVGIPGSVGGAIRGNAGAFGSSFSDVVKEAEVVDLETLNVKKFSKDDCLFGYRDSIFKRNSNLIVLSIILKMKKGEKSEIKKIMLLNVKSRALSCDYGSKSAGCFFKNISWDNDGINKEKLFSDFPELKKMGGKYKLPAGFLIQEVGLAGKNIGGAFVSEKHCNYILNKDGATAKDIKSLAELCKYKVYENFKIKLEEEVQLVGFE